MEVLMSKKSDEFTFRASGPAYLDPSQNDFVKSSGQRSDLSVFEPSLTRQEFAEECDINTIMARYETTGVISHVNQREAQYLDMTLYPGLQASMDAMREATLQFNALPANVRREFDNDPQKFVDFAVEKDNLPRMREWGLAPPEKAPEPPIRVEIANPPPPAGDPPKAS